MQQSPRCSQNRTAAPAHKFQTYPPPEFSPFAKAAEVSPARLHAPAQTPPQIRQVSSGRWTKTPPCLDFSGKLANAWPATQSTHKSTQCPAEYRVDSRFELRPTAFRR